jgi:hypothetical protein
MAFAPRVAVSARNMSAVLASAAWLRDDMLLPTLSTSLTVQSSRRVVEYYAAESRNPEPPKSEAWQETTFEFEATLTQNPRIQKRWQGAWDTLHSGSRDRIPQAAHSARELINQCLAELAPDEVFTDEEIKNSGSNGRPTLIARWLFARKWRLTAIQ